MRLSSLTLPTGRKLAYAEYGMLQSIPIFSFHGTPGCHLVPDFEAALAEEVGIHLIVPDRPGYGYSDFQTNRTLLDWADDVVAIATKLEITTFGIMGFSAGGPHALACAYQIPERLTKVVLVGGLGPVVLMGEERSPMTDERRSFKLQQLQADPKKWVEDFANSVSGPDAERIKNESAWIQGYRLEAFRQGVEGTVYDETLVLTKDWGFALEDISSEVYLWQGELDTAVPMQHGKFMAEHIPNSTAHFMPDVGHLMPVRVYKDIFELFINIS